MNFLSQPEVRPIAAAGGGMPLSGFEAAKNWLLAKRDSITPEMNGGIWIRAAIGRLEEGQSPELWRIGGAMFFRTSQWPGVGLPVVLGLFRYCQRERLDGSNIGVCSSYGGSI
ncbi:integrase catalytic region [Lasius niger]|uniref:Integrase catalytic region n=1 Tax=Lasius niger TaxID=67767 RepID=A0A0J7N6J3_LASNI|nr:integrase catalytic region [Lasius niger]